MEEKEDVSFVDQRFLSSRPLDDANVLEYFSGSPFYDKSCNNEILKMQTQFRGLDQKSKLSSMIGVFYEAESSNNEKTLFVIRKAYNHGDTTETLGMYYIIHGHIYAAPTNYSIYRCRMSDSMWLLNSFIDKMMEKRRFNPFNPSRGKHLRKNLEEGKDLSFMMEIFNDFKKEQIEP
ncbi:MED6 RNA polymerase II transcriptional regulation mediator [Encephalitozoon intestinalis ATCC 50506]|uniref:Mediator of RNA polymerase II transcription subunit 6 n=1 Tax=Encephalitozoon intestinalis (strain ATCC 50506) TaxID=876142 RepID=E0S5B5_ENCIT|nr:MED6 RNA polymerase II transcriptional regulation mediator [Encephalitozoon intestinalis ATCC 50506]ADM10900.1 MED6 RNA polymerase II transcriptional regulation mediator [Encephalitozoon intestinalis ATCC 50506]UTX44532.1 MED6 RNA polymerase II transcriptional regulation mediator [Encephalitozoon intestinalis]